MRILAFIGIVVDGRDLANTQDEIRETMREYGRTQFGGWPWKQREVAHGGPERVR